MRQGRACKAFTPGSYMPNRPVALVEFAQTATKTIAIRRSRTRHGAQRRAGCWALVFGSWCRTWPRTSKRLSAGVEGAPGGGRATPGAGPKAQSAWPTEGGRGEPHVMLRGTRLARTTLRFRRSRYRTGHGCLSGWLLATACRAMCHTRRARGARHNGGLVNPRGRKGRARSGSRTNGALAQ